MRILKKNWLYIVAALITLVGLITGKFFFLFLVIPFGFGFFKRDKKDSED